MTTHVTDPPSDVGAPDVLVGAEPVSAPESVARRSARAAWIGLGALGIMALAVFWAFEALPFMDLPAHAGLIAMRHRFAESAFEQRFYVLAPHIGPYSLFRFLGEVFVRVIGPINAVRVLATLPVVATPLALLYARRRLFDDKTPTYGYIGLALSFGFMTLMGFASYLLGVAVMLFGLTRWLELLAATDEGEDVKRREIAMAIVAPAIFVAHGHAFVLFLLCAFVSAASTGRRIARFVRLRALAPAVGLAAWVAWIERGTATPEGSVPVVPQLVPLFRGFAEKVELLVTPTLMTRSGIDFMLAIAFWVVALACAFYSVRALVRGRRASLPPAEVRHSAALHACAGALTVLFVALPHVVGWFGFVDGRLLPLILVMVLVGARRRTLPRPLAATIDVGAPLAAGAVASVALVASFFFQREAVGYREVLARVPAQATLLNLPLDPDSDVFTAHPFIHYDKLVLADRPVLVSDVWFHQGSALYPTRENPALNLPPSYSESDLKLIEWPAYRLDDWDYVLIRTRVTSSQPYTPDALTLEQHIGGWWLFRRANTAR
ncbi:MAG: hypothetical protein KF819_08160 [Labilithrix sp.]|nr:hypothetical protein [Labilithrix sp.]